jgi:CRP-like cAMP-binding protein
VPFTKHTASENRLIAALPHEDRQHFLDGCERVELVFADILCKAGDTIQYVHFPIGSVISLLAQTDDNFSVEVGMVGNEGMIGIPLVLGVDFSPLHLLVQGAGVAWRMDALSFRRELQLSFALKLELDRYLYVMTTQFAQIATCTRFHMVDARLARWLLMMEDRVNSDKFHVTHEILAHMLGVRRVSVTNVAGSLQRKKLISYSRGEITILDRSGLEAVCCGCYRAGKETYDRVLGYPRGGSFDTYGDDALRVGVGFAD